MVRKIRIHKAAAFAQVPSKYLVRAYQNIAPDLNVKSASSQVEITVDNRIFHESVTNAAIQDFVEEWTS